MSEATARDDRQMIVPPGMEQVLATVRYAPAVKAGHTVYVSGQIGRDADMQLAEGREAQMVQAFENLRKVLAAADATMDDIVDLTTGHTDLRDVPLYMQVRDRDFGDFRPTWTAIGAHRLCGQPDDLIEIKAVAVLRAQVPA